MHAAIKGKRYVTREIAKDSGTEMLTQREREVLQLLAEGKSMKQAAAVLAVNHRTIVFHKYRMMERLRIKTTAELIQFAIQNHVMVS